MNPLAIEKNRLDLAYKRNLQLLNIILIVGAGSLISYLAGLIINPDLIFQYSILLIVIGVLTYIFYSKINEDLRNISKRIGRLAKNKP